MERNRSNFPPSNSWKKTWIFPMVDPETNKQSVSWNVKKKKRQVAYSLEMIFFSFHLFFPACQTSSKQHSPSSPLRHKHAWQQRQQCTPPPSYHFSLDDIISIFFLPFSGLMQPPFFLAVVSIRKRGRNK